MGPALGLAAVGVGLGSAGAALLGRVLAADLYEVSPHDPLALGLAALVLLGAAAAASAIPARRAARIDPLVALRSE
jgi:ABC-type antimicrobial peptide transport system permease subunit